MVQLPPSLGASTLLHTPVVAEEPARAKRPRYPKPDIDQLLPFKPRAIVRKLRVLWMSAQAESLPVVLVLHCPLSKIWVT